MKRMIRVLALLLLLSLLPLPSVMADELYLISDSNTRRLTKAELMKWDRESLSFIFNEIFARHGYVFNAGSKFDVYFRQFQGFWYTPNSNPDNQKMVYPYLSKIEWDNYHLIKQVIQEMESAPGYKAHDPSKKCYRNHTFPTNNLQLTGFYWTSIAPGQKLPVYSAPSYSAWRGSNGKALVNTDGAVWCAGWENGWLLIFYELTGGTNAGGVRVGYVYSGDMRSRPSVGTQLLFDYRPVQLISTAALTDDPLRGYNTITTLSAGTTVTYLTTVCNQYGQYWDYVETSVGGKPVRGYVPSGCVSQPAESFPW